MVLKQITLLSALAMATLNAQAKSVEPSRMIIAPTCLLQRVQVPYQTLATRASLAFIRIDKNKVSALSEAKAQHQTLCGGFVDVTRDWQATQASPTNAATFLTRHAVKHKPALTAAKKATYRIQYETQVNQLLAQINPQNMWNNLTSLSTEFNDRHADSDLGVAAANWLKDQAQDIAASNHRNDVTAYFIQTGTAYKQPSLVVKVGNSNEPGIVIGAHMDTLSSQFSSKKPGADDDGSGSVTVLETYRTVLASGMQFKRPIYFIWYAAEEEGLVGSGYVVNEFTSKHIPVAAVMHMDLTGYAYRNQSTMWLIDDNVDTALTAYLGTLIQTYVKQPIKHTACGYECSDHANWTNGGFAAAIPAEAAYENTNPTIHSSQDTMDKLSLTHMTDYLKLATAFAVEMAEPVSR